MHISRLDLNLFVVFDAIYTEGGVTRASEVLNLSQPAVSHALARLRDLMKDPLFVREGQRIVPTPMARALIDPVRRSLRILQTTLNETSSFDPNTVTRHFTIGLRNVMETTILAPLMRTLYVEAPTIDISTTRFDRTSLESQLLAGTLDVALDILLPASDSVHRRLAYKDRMVVLARRGHPDIDGSLDLDAYLKQKHILVTSRPKGHGLEDLSLSRLGRSRHIGLRCQQSVTASRIVSETNMVLTLAERFARTANTMFDNQVLPLPFEAVDTEIYLYWHTNADADPASTWLRNTLIDSLTT